MTRTLRLCLTRDQIDVLRGLMLRQSILEGWRHHAMLEVLLATALRTRELVALDVGDLCLEAATLTIRGLGGKSCTIGLPAAAVMALLAYLLGRPKLLRANACSFDITNVALLGPGDEATAGLPVTFHWAGRGISGETYSISFLDPETAEEVAYSDPAATSQFTLHADLTVGNATLVPNTSYRWTVFVVQGSWSNGYGEAYQTWDVTLGV